jgi:hypothetical protein
VLKVSVAFICFGSFAAAWAIQRSLYRRISFSIALLPLFLFNFFLFYGFLNYLMGVTIGLIGIAVFIIGNRTISLGRMISLALIGAIASLCHILAFAGFMLVIVLLAVEKTLAGSAAIRRRRVIGCTTKAAAVAAPGVCLYLLSEKPSLADRVSYDFLRGRCGF